MTRSQASKPSAVAPALPDHEAVLASLIGAVVVLSDRDRVSYVNQAAEALFGRSGSALVGQSSATLFEGAGWLAELVERVKTAPHPSLRDEGPIRTGDATAEVLAMVTVLRDRDGHAAGTVVAVNDLGSRHRMHTDELARTRLVELDNLVATLGHEINNPLSGIRGAAQLLGKKLVEQPDLAEYAAMIVRQADRMATLIHDLMELEKPMPAIEPINIHRVLHEVLLLEQAEATAHGIDITTEFDPSLPSVLGDNDQLQQLFINLLKNAIAACPQADGRVRVGTCMENRFYVETESQRVRYIAVEVTDNGHGLDEETAQHMFTPFFSRTSGGNGMGLTIARNIATAHKGHLRGENVDGGGACFRVMLPVAERRKGG